MRRIFRENIRGKIEREQEVILPGTDKRKSVSNVSARLLHANQLYSSEPNPDRRISLASYPHYTSCRSFHGKPISPSGFFLFPINGKRPTSAYQVVPRNFFRYRSESSRFRHDFHGLHSISRSSEFTYPPLSTDQTLVERLLHSGTLMRSRID